ncbi:hypothetical protein D770_22755 [Flammeovirgaceae bacterium 311]|nr:hypothetical protein D770_22755 [Flammeovirgaceae bacterium 311]
MDEKTKLIFGSGDACNKVRHFVVGKNEENFDKLENELSGMIS